MKVKRRTFDLFVKYHLERGSLPPGRRVVSTIGRFFQLGVSIDF